MFESFSKRADWPVRRLADGLKINKNSVIEIDDLMVYPILGVTNRGGGVTIKRQVNGSDLTMRHYQIASPNQLMWCKVDTKNGAFGVVRESHKGAVASQNMCLADIDIKVFDPDYLQYFFRLPAVFETITEVSLGSTNRQYLKPQEFLDTVCLRLPPLEEQRRIVAKIDNLATKIEGTSRVRQQATQEAEALTDSVMNEILNKASSKTSWELGPIPMFANVNPSRTGQIDLTPEDPVSFVPMKAVDDVTGKISWPEVRPFREVAKGYTWFKDGDVIFARITPCMQNGKAAIARNLLSGNGFGSTEFHVIRPGPKLLAEWLHSLVRHKAFREDAAKTFKGTAGQQRVPQSFLDQKVIAVPLLAEQRQIIGEIDALRGKVDELKRMQAETVAELNSFLPSILDKAFKGGL